MEIEVWLRQTRRGMVNLNKCPGCKALKVINVENMAPAAKKRAAEELAKIMPYLRGGISAREMASSLTNPVEQDCLHELAFVTENFAFRIKSEHYDGC